MVTRVVQDLGVGGLDQGIVTVVEVDRVDEAGRADEAGHAVVAGRLVEVGADPLVVVDMQLAIVLAQGAYLLEDTMEGMITNDIQGLEVIMHTPLDEATQGLQEDATDLALLVVDALIAHLEAGIILALRFVIGIRDPQVGVLVVIPVVAAQIVFNTLERSHR